MLQKVAATGVDLDSVYDQTLQRIKDQKGDRSRLGIEVLMWVSLLEYCPRMPDIVQSLVFPSRPHLGILSVLGKSCGNGRIMVMKNHVIEYVCQKSCL